MGRSQRLAGSFVASPGCDLPEASDFFGLLSWLARQLRPGRSLSNPSTKSMLCCVLNFTRAVLRGESSATQQLSLSHHSTYSYSAALSSALKFGCESGAHDYLTLASSGRFTDCAQLHSAATSLDDQLNCYFTGRAGSRPDHSTSTAKRQDLLHHLWSQSQESHLKCHTCAYSVGSGDVRLTCLAHSCFDYYSRYFLYQCCSQSLTFARFHRDL